MNTNHASRVEIQAKYNKLWINQFFPTEQEIIEQDRAIAVKECWKAAKKDWSVRAVLIAGLVLAGVIIGC